MTSKWINKDLFGKFQEKKKEEKDMPQGGTGLRRMEIIWPNPQKGTDTTPKVYVGRFLPDKKGNFYKSYFYHFFKSGEKWQFFLCPKTHDFEAFCPFCVVSSRLYMGTAADKKLAPAYKRKQRFVSNWYIVDDPRDSERAEEDKMKGQVRLYEFPGKVEMKLKEQITDTRYGLGPAIFDPSEEGYDFILKVMATKRDQNGNVWPDYSNSEFARRSSALGTEEEIDEIMASTHDINEYLENLERADEDIMNALKAEMLWDIVSDEWKRHKGGSTESTKTTPPSESRVETNSESTVDTEEDIDDTQWDDKEDDSEESDEDLLKELEGM